MRLIDAFVYNSSRYYYSGKEEGSFEFPLISVHSYIVSHKEP